MLNPEIDISFDTEPSAAKKSKKQQLVKHKRKNWKKTDLDDVEQGIDDYRQQQLTGYAFWFYWQPKRLLDKSNNLK